MAGDTTSEDINDSGVDVGDICENCGGEARIDKEATERGSPVFYCVECGAVNDEEWNWEIPPEPEEIAQELGKWQEEVLRMLGVYAGFGSSSWTPYSNITEDLKGGYEGKKSNVSPSVSRAVDSLCNRRLIQGAYQAWCVWEGQEGDLRGPISYGENPSDEVPEKKDGSLKRPRLTHLRLTEEGREVINALRS